MLMACSSWYGPAGVISMSDKMILYFWFLHIVPQHQSIYKYVLHGNFNNV